MLEIINIAKKYKRGSKEFIALDNVTIKIKKGDFVSVTGASGSGKSTLLNAIGGLIHPDSGKIIFNGESIYDQSENYLNNYRKETMGFVFQQFHLLPYLSVLGNIMLVSNDKLQSNSIDNYLENCSLTDLKNKYPSELSVGEKQRAAFVRAIISNPEVLLADEPTGNLDPDNSNIIMSLIGEYHRSGGTVVLVSHDPTAARYSNQNINLEKGRIVF